MKKIEMLIMAFCGLLSVSVFLLFLGALVSPRLLDFLILSRWKIIYILAGSLILYKFTLFEIKRNEKRKMLKGENI